MSIDKMKGTPFTLADLKGRPCANLNKTLLEEPKKKEKKANKYNAVRVEYDGLWFDSLKERSRYINLKYLEINGDIKDIVHHVVFRLELTNKKVCDYEADFQYTDIKSGKMIVEDVKSTATRKLSTYRLKKKLMLAQYGIEIKEV